MVALVPAAYAAWSPCAVSAIGGYAAGSGWVRVSTATSSVGMFWVPALSWRRLKVGSVQVVLTPSTKPELLSPRSLRPAKTLVKPSGRFVSQWPAVSTFVGLMTVPVQNALKNARPPGLFGSGARKLVTMPTTDGKSAELAVVPPTMFGVAVVADRALNGAPYAPTLGSGPVARTALGGSLPCGKTPALLPGTGRVITAPDVACATGDIMAAVPIATPTTRPTAHTRRNPMDLTILDTLLSLHRCKPGRTREGEWSPNQFDCSRAPRIPYVHAGHGNVNGLSHFGQQGSNDRAPNDSIRLHAGPNAGSGSIWRSRSSRARETGQG